MSIYIECDYCDASRNITGDGRIMDVRRQLSFEGWHRAIGDEEDAKICDYDDEEAEHDMCPKCWERIKREREGAK